MVNSITLQFTEDIKSLEGWMYGYMIYMNQVYPLLLDDQEYIDIVIPDHIEHISSSFLKGFCHKWSKYGASHILEYVHFKTNPKLQDEIIINMVD